MNGSKIKRVINVIYLIAAIVVLLGAFFRLQHYPYGNYLLLGGVILGIVAGITKLAVAKG